MRDYLSTDVARLSPQQRAALEETADWKFLLPPSPVSLRGNDAHLHEVWAEAVVAGKENKDYDWESVNRHIRLHVDRLGGGGELVERVYQLGFNFGALSRFDGSDDAALQSRLDIVHHDAEVALPPDSPSDSVAHSPMDPQGPLPFSRTSELDDAVLAWLEQISDGAEVALPPDAQSEPVAHSSVDPQGSYPVHMPDALRVNQQISRHARVDLPSMDGRRRATSPSSPYPSPGSGKGQQVRKGPSRAGGS
ncbi:hypothetical protein ACJ6WF_27380 [Streptomyces sp. MMS24-I2-30]|uniref:hypothetical protein n=1 Tax=Streptomyces sp. MMS24-I2-30 TaxID=3351564 RepID=UPI003896DD9E